MNLGPTDVGIGNRLPLGQVVTADFFARPSDEVAPELLGKILWRKGVGGGRLTEVEAYLPSNDPACHAARGRTRRNAPMFGPPGCLYIYRSYGIHLLLNLVCDRESIGSAVLIRSFDPLGDTSLLVRNRAGQSRKNGTKRVPRYERSGGPSPLARGPGRVGQALGLDLALNGLPLGEESGIYVIDDGAAPRVRRSTRIGISKGVDLPLRFDIRDAGGTTRPPRSQRGGGA